ncbi:MAG: 30S ribosomal protein S12 methylthiotransferase RimO [Corallococcus sp.]|nr:30S ribosomal protein S12 methylthiotransferase RimO [Corallococcus sp.]
MTKKVGVVSLGCDKNRVDTECMLAKLKTAGYQIVNNPLEADILIVNTCAFIEAARKESIDTILEMSEYKANGNCQCLIVTGCLGQKFGEEVFEHLTEADCVIGTNDYDNIVEIIEKSLQHRQKILTENSKCITAGDRVLTTPSHYAYIKIADGCNNFCSYCLIPHIRGYYRSRPMDDIVDEAVNLAKSGIKEIILVAQDVTNYGKDIYRKIMLVELIRKLSEIDGIHWIRLLYCYPELVTDQLLYEIANNNKVAKYIDIPLQHINDGVLKNMNRRAVKSQICNLFEKIADIKPQIYVRSTFICGFPQETLEAHCEVAEFLKKYKLRNVGFFAYSREDGTPAAKFPNQISTRTKNSRVRKLYEIQSKILRELNCACLGKIYECIVDEFVENNKDSYVYLGRTEFMAPEIDGNVYINSKTPLSAGSFVKVKITDALEYDLIGDKVN